MISLTDESNIMVKKYYEISEQLNKNLIIKIIIKKKMYIIVFKKKFFIY